MKLSLYHKIRIIFCLIISINTNALSQDSLIVRHELNLKDNISFINSDASGFIYLIKKDEIIKINSKGKELFRYSNKSIGEISGFDISNALRPLVFYAQQSKIIILDNTLSVQETINLEDISLYRITEIANSNIDNGIWLYDNDLKQIIKIDTKLNIIFESGNISMLLNKKNIVPISLKEKNGRLYIGTKKDGILIFDIYCSYLFSLDVNNSYNLFIDEEMIYSWNNNKIIAYNSKTHNNKELLTKGKYSSTIRYKNEFLALSINKLVFLKE